MTRTCRVATLVVKGERREEGVGLIEAPRGTLFHHYRVDKKRPGVMGNLMSLPPTTTSR